jgi:hypothetical protein
MMFTVAGEEGVHPDLPSPHCVLRHSAEILFLRVKKKKKTHTHKKKPTEKNHNTQLTTCQG